MYFDEYFKENGTIRLDDEAFRNIIAKNDLTEEQMDRGAPQRRVATWARSRASPSSASPRARTTISRSRPARRQVS